MPVEILQTGNPRVVEAHLTVKLDKEDYAHLVPTMEALLKERGKINMLVEMHDFHGWTGGAVWEDLKLDMKHFSDLERVAMVGETKWQQGMAVFCKPFTTATVRYFDEAKSEEALNWIHEGITQPV